MEESKTADVPNEINHGPIHSTFANSTMIEAQPNDTAIEVINDYPQVVEITYGNFPVYETSEINHDHYRFAYDLVEKVLEIRRELRPDVPHILPEPHIYLFTGEHKNIVTSLLKTWNRDSTRLVKEIYPLTNGVYDYESYVTCRDYFVEYWQTKEYTEKSFISACAIIANIAALFIQMNSQCGALDDVVTYIASWIEEILAHGTIAQSQWGQWE